MSKTRDLAKNIVEIIESKDITRMNDELSDFIINNPQSEELIKRLCDTERAEYIQNNIRSRNKKNDVTNLVRILERQKKKKRERRNLRLKLTSVAAAFITISFLVYTTLQNRDDRIVTVQSNETNKPTLILESGDVILLSETKDKIIANEMTIDVNKIISDAQKPIEHPKEISNRLIVPSGNSCTIELSDSTEIIVNASSELHYPSKFSGNTREVTLKGEAFFNVSKSDKPFIVKLTNGQVKVYGTAFNVKSSKNGNIETILISGSVGIGYKDKSEIMLKPNQRILINAVNDDYIIENVNSSQAIGWINNSFQHINSEVTQIIEDIENWYGITINDQFHKLSKTQKMDLCIGRNASADKVISLLEEALNLVIINEGGGNYSIK